MKRIHVNSIRATGVIGFVMIVLVFLTIPPNAIPDLSSNQNVIILDSPEDIVEQAKAVSSASVVNTDVKFTETDSSKITQFLDSNNIDSPLSTEKFGIITDVALFDSNNQKTTSTNIIGVNELPSTLSVVDEQGNPLDFGGHIQVTFDSITQSLPKSVTSWGTVKFFLDDRLFDTKKLWSSHNNIQKQSMSLVSSLNFETKPLVGLSEFPLSPSFSEREKRNYTYDFSDENLSNGLHTFRVVLYDINAVVDSNVFYWTGENIVYELQFNVDNSLITKIAESGNGQKTTTFKSDGKFVLKLPSTTYCYTSPISKQCLSTEPFHNLSPKIELLSDGKRIAFVPKGTDSSSNLLPDVISTIPRGTNLKILIDDITVYDEKTPLYQRNYELACIPTIFSVSTPSIPYTLNNQPVTVNILASISLENRCSSSFGYEHVGDSYIVK